MKEPARRHDDELSIALYHEFSRLMVLRVGRKTIPRMIRRTPQIEECFVINVLAQGDTLKFERIKKTSSN